MTAVLALAPAATLLCGALVAFFLEAVGTPPGARKRLERVHLPWLVAGWCAAAGAATWGALDARAIDTVAASATAVVLLLVAVAHVSATDFLRSIDEERGELSAAYLLFGAGACVAVGAEQLVMFAAGATLMGVAGAFLSAPDREGPHGIEAAARLLFALGLFLALATTGVAFAALAGGSDGLVAFADGASDTARTALVIAFVMAATLAGAAPLHQRFVDVAHGAASSTTGLLAACGLLVGGVLSIRLVGDDASDKLHDAMLALALLSLIGTPLAALSQVRVGRLVAYLSATQVGVPLAALAGASATAGVGVAMVALCVGAIAACAALLGVTLATRHPAATWEDWSGYGRTRPVVAALFIYALGTCAGMPGTPGFLVRLAAARMAIGRGDELAGLVCIGSIAIAAAPVVRLALFLFAKAPTGSARGARTHPAYAFIGLVVGLALLALMPRSLDWVARFVERAS